MIFRFEKYTSQAIELLKSSEQSIRNNPGIVVELANCYIDLDEHEQAIELLSKFESDSDPDIALALANILEDQEKMKEALDTVHNFYIKHPNNKSLRYKYARLAQEFELHSVALYLLDDLLLEDQNSIEYWGYLGNSCLALDLYDKALVAYRRAEALVDENSNGQWIVSNIGNLLNYRGFHSEACDYLQKAITMNSDSDYAHDRLASSLKNKDEQLKEYRKKVAEGRRAIRAKEMKCVEAEREHAEDADTEMPA
jgi:tetratricopeptide (TPR) repeat protein